MCMSKLKEPLSPEENKRLFEVYDKAYRSHYPLSVRQLAKMFKRNQPRIIKEMNRWKGVKRYQNKPSVIELDPVSMDQVREQYGRTI